MKTSAALLAAALALVALAPDAAHAATNATLCADTTRVVLSTCGTSVCAADQPCVQFPSGASAKCSAASRNKCVVSDATCTFQCLNSAYNPSRNVQKWTLFVKEPKTTDMFTDATDEFPAALVDKIASGVFSSETLGMCVLGACGC